MISTRVGSCEHNLNEISPWRIQRVNEPAFADDTHVPQMEEPHLRDYWKVVVKYRRLIVTVFLGLFVSGGYIISGATPMYTATATVKIDPQNPQFIQIAEVLNLQVGSGDYFSTQHELMKSRALAAKVISELRLESNREFTSSRVVNPDPFKWLSSKFFGVFQSIMNFFSSLSGSSQPKVSQLTNLDKQSAPIGKEASALLKHARKPAVSPGNIGRYLSFLRIEPMRGTRLVKIVFNTPDPNLSQQLANAHAAAFVRMNLETRFEVTKEARQFLETKLAELRSKVEESEAELSEFRKTHGVVSMDRGENLIVDRMMSLNTSLTSARIKRIELESLHQMLQKKSASDLNEVMTNAIIQQYRSVIETLIAEQVKLATVLKPDHPRMIELSTRLNDTRQRMKAAITEVVHRIETDYEAARNREAFLEAEAGRQKQAAIDLKGLGVKYSVIQGEAESNRTLYNSLLSRLNETTISSDLPVSNMQVTELADTPGGLSSGGQQLKFLMATAAGALFVALGLAFCLAYFDSTISTPEDVWRFIFLPTLGVVPDLKSFRHRVYNTFQPKTALTRLPKEAGTLLLSYFRGRADDSQNRNLTILEHPLSVMSEAYRAIRTMLLFSQAEKPPQTVLFTSPCPGEGKTATTLNLAITFAQSGKSVLVIDADMRRGRCHQLLRRQNHRGLSNILTGNLTLEEGVQETGVPGLSLLSRGVTSPNPADLLGSRKMLEVLDVLRKRFEFILIDTSPAIGVSDAEVLSQYCDGVVLVIHGQNTSRFSARQALERLEAVHARVLGVVLNGVDLRSPDYASYRYYYASYYASSNGAEKEGGSKQLIENPLDSKNKTETAWPTQEPTDSVPKHFFDRITLKLIEAAGPMAPIIIQDQVALLGESLETFPKSRLKELCDEVSREILDEKLRNSFQKTMSDYSRSL